MISKLFITVLCAAFVVLFDHSLSFSSARAEENITFKIVDNGFQYPSVVISVVSIHSDGTLTALDGAKLNKDGLQTLLTRTKRVDGKEMCLIRLLSSEEKEVSIELLGKVLHRMRSLANPRIPTVVYVCLRELPAVPEKDR